MQPFLVTDWSLDGFKKANDLSLYEHYSHLLKQFVRIFICFKTTTDVTEKRDAALAAESEDQWLCSQFPQDSASQAPSPFQVPLPHSISTVRWAPVLYLLALLLSDLADIPQLLDVL